MPALIKAPIFNVHCLQSRHTHSRLDDEAFLISTTSEGTMRTACRYCLRYGGQISKARCSR